MKGLFSFIVLIVFLSILALFTGCKTTIMEFETDPAKFYVNERGEVIQPVKKLTITYNSQIEKTYAARVVGFGLRIKLSPRDIISPIDIWLGYMGSEKASAVKGKKAVIKKNYKDIAILNPSGNIKTSLIVGEDIEQKKPKKKLPATLINKIDKNILKDLSINMLYEIMLTQKTRVNICFTSPEEPVADANIRV